MGNPRNVIAGTVQAYVGTITDGVSPPNPITVGPSTTIATALTTTGAITSLPVAALPAAVASGDVLTVTSGAYTQNFTASAAAAQGATAVTITSATPNFAYPVGSTVTDTTAVPPETPVWNTELWTPVGFTVEGLKEGWDPKTVDYNVEEQMTPVGVAIDTLDDTWSLTLAEDTLANQALAKGNSGQITVTAPGSNSVGTTELTLGDTLTQVAVGFQGLNAYGLWRVAYIPVAITASKVETSYRRAKEYRQFPLMFRALCDPTLISVTDRTV